MIEMVANETDWQLGKRAGEIRARALDPEWIRHNSETVPGSPAYKAGWRLGFANVRNEIVRQSND
jgi:hypothetical protein